MNKYEVINWLRKTDLSLTSISKRTNISRSTLYNWIEGKEMSDKSYDKLVSIYKKDIRLHKGTLTLKIKDNPMLHNKGVGTEIDSESYIDKLHKIIKYQEKDIEALKKAPAQKLVERELWNNVNEDLLIETEIRLNLKKLDFGRTIKSIEGVENLSRALGYSESFIKYKIYNLGEYERSSDEASIKKFITNDSYKGLMSITKSFFKGLELFKKLVSKDKDYFLETDIQYIAKDGSLVNTKCFNWVDLDFHESHFSVKSKMVIGGPELN